MSVLRQGMLTIRFDVAERLKREAAEHVQCGADESQEAWC